MQVSTVNLERVRKVKTRHQRLLSRVTTVREELERFLEDDDDMAKMCLTRRREVSKQSMFRRSKIRHQECACNACTGMDTSKNGPPLRAAAWRGRCCGGAP